MAEMAAVETAAVRAGQAVETVLGTAAPAEAAWAETAWAAETDAEAALRHLRSSSRNEG